MVRSVHNDNIRNNDGSGSDGRQHRGGLQRNRSHLLDLHLYHPALRILHSAGDRHKKAERLEILPSTDPDLPDNPLLHILHHSPLRGRQRVIYLLMSAVIFNGLDLIVVDSIELNFWSVKIL